MVSVTSQPDFNTKLIESHRWLVKSGTKFADNNMFSHFLKGECYEESEN